MSKTKDAKYTAEEIQSVAPRYRGTPNNFNPMKVGKFKAPRSAPRGPKSATLPPPTYLNVKQNPTPQRNDLILEESIFGIESSVVPINQDSTQTSNYSKLPNITDEVYDQISVVEQFIDRTLVKEELRYYTTAMLTFRLIEIKAKQGREALTPTERQIRTMLREAKFKIPEPIFVYLSQIGRITDKAGQETDVSIPPLPVTQINGYGGYHSDTIDAASHLLYEEVPCLGLAGDVVMTLAAQQDRPEVALRLNHPAGSVPTANLLNYISRLEPRRPEIKRRLVDVGITSATFPEDFVGTRINLKYLDTISDMLGRYSSFKMKHVLFPDIPLKGGTVQIIKTHPVPHIDVDVNIRDAVVQATSSTKEREGVVGAAYVVGFQLHKEQALTGTVTQQAARWCCLTSTNVAPWVIPQAWIQNRNQRRDLQGVQNTEQFRGRALSQKLTTLATTRRFLTDNR